MLRTAAIIMGFAVAVWAFCGAIMGIGPMFLSMEDTLVVHAAGAPLGAALAAYIYFRLFGEVAPLTLAGAFVGTALALDALVVSAVFLGTFEMFASVLGLWVPMALIFAATWIVGSLAAGR